MQWTWILKVEDSGHDSRGIGVLKRAPISPGILPKMQVCKEDDLEGGGAWAEAENGAGGRGGGQAADAGEEG